MKFSIIVGFRNRDAQRVQNSLKSLASQTVTDFELIFVDYGSDEEVSKQIKPLVNSYSFAKYIYTDTVGLLWNKSSALNIGINNAKGEIIIISDIDIIFELDFIKKVSKYDYNKIFLTFNAIYLAENFNGSPYSIKSYDDLHNGFIGLTVVKRSLLNKINGFDEYYLVWGAEDEDIIKRLEIEKITRRHMMPSEISIFHQWHILNSPAQPSFWLINVINYLHNNNISIREQKHESILFPETRPIYKILTNKKFKKHERLQLTGKKLHAYYGIFNTFFALKSNEICWFEINNWNKPIIGKMTNIVNSINIFFDKIKKFHFRLTRVEYFHEKKEISFEDLHLFWIYFIGQNRQHIKDYFYHKDNETILVIFIKK